MGLAKTCDAQNSSGEVELTRKMPCPCSLKQPWVDLVDRTSLENGYHENNCDWDDKARKIEEGIEAGTDMQGYIYE